jgi:hypothetical protein
MGKWMTGVAFATLTATAVVSSAWADKEFFKLDKTELAKGKEFDIKFAEAQSSKSGDQEWITICNATAPDSEYGTWKYVDDKATKATLMAPSTPGKFEVRLHQHYPAKSYNVVQRVKVEVK